MWKMEGSQMSLSYWYQINSINLQVQVIGDSHARRIRDQSGVYFKCRDVDISFWNYIDGSFCSRVVIMTLLPRADPWYQERMKQLNAMLTSNTKDSIVGWYWLKKLKGYLSSTDGVHLIEQGYQKALLYLGSPIFYFYKPSYKIKQLIWVWSLTCLVWIHNKLLCRF